MVQASMCKKCDPAPKIAKAKNPKSLPSEYKDLSSNPSTGPQKYNKCKYKNKKGHEFIKFFFKEKKSITVLYVRKHPYFLRYILKYAGESWYTWDFL